MTLGTSSPPGSIVPGKIGEMQIPPSDLEASLVQGDRSAINYLVALAEEHLKNARVIRSIAVELLNRIEPEQARRERLQADTAYNNLDMRFRRSARLLVELLETPDLPRKDEELADLICVRKPSVPALRVYVHDLRTSLSRAGLEGVVKCRRGQGYFIQSEDIERILDRVG
ncbi:hypothetical protein WBP07_20290 (plasmid) [Novosphingobium sp. BL-8A]|uniref:hypothetical protein n=1 Tax=Novosphingobium sp. BL-8A TaxID=3127639 RepID=UPI0037583D8A